MTSPMTSLNNRPANATRRLVGEPEVGKLPTVERAPQQLREMKREARTVFSEREGIMILVFLLALVLPLSTSFWIVSLILSATNGGGFDPISPARWLISILVPVIIAGYGLKKKSVDRSGAVTGLFVGFILTLSSYCFMTTLLCFFLTASKATQFRSSRKQKMEFGFKEGGQRNWVQVLCNGGVATELAIIYMIDRGYGENVIDFVVDYRSSWLSMGILGALACSNGDTWASELGSVVGKGLPVLVTNFKTVPRGTNGAVTLAGLVFSALGGFTVGLAYYCALLICVHPHLLADSPAQWPVMIVATLAGLIGSLIDSFLGATLQYSGLDKKSGKIVDSPGDKVEHVSGYGFLDNHSVNLMSGVLMAIITPNLAMYVWQMV